MKSMKKNFEVQKSKKNESFFEVYMK